MRFAPRTIAIAFLCLQAPGALALNAGLGDPPDSVTRDTPLAAVEGFMRAAHAERYGEAAHYLWLNHIPKALQNSEGARLARRLRFVIDRKLYLDYGKLSQEFGDSPRGKVQVGVIPLPNGNQPLHLVRVQLPGGGQAWIFDEDTVRAIDRLYDLYGPPFGEKLPDFLYSHSLLGLELWQWLGLIIVLAIATLAALVLQRWGLRVLGRISRLKALKRYESVVESARGPLRLPIWAAVTAVGTRELLLPPSAQHLFDVIDNSLLIIAVSWFLLRFLRRSATYIQQLAAQESEDPVRIRGIRTQLTVLNRVFEIAIYVVAAALLLMQFEFVRNVGVSLLASAGIAGLVIGLAAQRSISTLLAGIQLSITQPIRIGDTVVVEGENGTIEEITLTYVVVKIWDLRRLVIPMTYFLEKPFQNWSKGTSHLLGTVILQVDHLADVNPFREELARVLESEGRELWDGRMQEVKVVESTDRTMTLRVLISANDPAALWNLRCLVRERLMGLLQNHPDWLPTSRTETRSRDRGNDKLAASSAPTAPEARKNS